jgi:hypothetical protein
MPLPDFPFLPGLYIATHRGAERETLVRCPLSETVPGGCLQAGGAEWTLGLESRTLSEGGHAMRLSARVLSGQAREVAAGFSLVDEAWSEANYVLIPGAVYAGNRFVLRPHPYPPPMWGPRSKADRDEVHTIELPGLRQSGESWLDQMSIDAAVPALCVYFPGHRRALCLFTAQEGSHGCFNYEVVENERRDRAEILLGCPGMRHGRYFTVKWKAPSGYALPSQDRAVDLEAGESIVFDF